MRVLCTTAIKIIWIDVKEILPFHSSAAPLTRRWVTNMEFKTCD